MENVKQEVQSNDCSDIGAGERKRGPLILRSVPAILLKRTEITPNWINILTDLYVMCGITMPTFTRHNLHSYVPSVTYSSSPLSLSYHH